MKTNLPDFSRQLRAAGAYLGPKVVRPAARAAASILRAEVVKRAPRRTGRLRRAIYIKRSRDSKAGRELFIVGVRQGKSARRLKRRGRDVNLDAYYWRFLEGGWIPRREKLRGGRRSRALQRERMLSGGARKVAYPFIKPAFIAARERALQKFFEVVEAKFSVLQRV